MYRQREKELTGGIILDETLQEILLVRGARSKKLGLPKGHVEAGESYLEGAIREIWEEAGLKIELAVPVLPCILTLRAKLFLIAVRKDKCRLNIKDTNEIEEVGWYPIDQLHLLEEDATMMLKDLRQRMPHILEKIRANIDNYDLSQKSKKIRLNGYLHDYINPHLCKPVDGIIEIVKRKFGNLFYQPELKSAVESLKKDAERPVTRSEDRIETRSLRAQIESITSESGRLWTISLGRGIQKKLPKLLMRHPIMC